MNSPYRAHPALHSQPVPAGNTIPFPAGQAKPAAPSPPPAEASTKLVALVKLEGDIRDQKTVAALSFHAVNDARVLVGFRQGWFFRLNRRNRFVLEAVADIASVDLNAPLVIAVTRAVNHVDFTKGAQPLSLAALQGGAYPHGHGLLVPLLDQKGKAFACLLLARGDAWPENERNVALRVCGTYGHALRALTPPALLRKLSLPRWALYGVPLVAAVLAFVPVPMTALAPFEVVAFEPTIIAAPIDGVIFRIAADANTQVKKGDLLFTLDDTRLRAEAEISAQKVQVAESRLATARNGAFQDVELKRSLAATESELQLAKAEEEYARSMMARSEVRAGRKGLLIYSAKSEWIGKPVRTGEKIMEIADPTRVAYRLELPVQDAIALDSNREVRLFLDADPLQPHSALIKEVGYHAREVAGGSLAYIITARPSEGDRSVRIGLRGTAQVSGADVPLGFYLLRRPIAALRQYFGR